MPIRNAKTRPVGDPYQIFEGRGWTWKVLKFYSNDLTDPYARVFCHVASPMLPEGELGDVYLTDIRRYGILTYQSEDYKEAE